MNVTNARNCLFICEINWQKEKRARKRMFTGLHKKRILLNSVFCL